MDKEKEVETVRLLSASVHETAERASTLYERDRRYRREDLYQVIDQERLESAQIIAEIFLRAAQLRDALHLKALLDALLETGELRRKRRRLAARPTAAGLGVSGVEFFRRQQRMNELVGFLVMEILCIAFEHILSKRVEDDFGGGGTAAYLVNTVPELRPPCPIEEDLGDVDSEQESYQEGEL